MGNSPSPGGPEPPQHHPPASDLDQLAQCLSAHEQTLQEISERLFSTETYQQQAAADTAQRFEAMRAAFSELRTKIAEQPGEAGYKDDQRRRLIEFLGYEPTAQQQVQLFTAFAAWHATEPRLVENRTAEYRTKKGDLVSYGYADLAGVIATAQTAAPFGLVAVTRQELDDNGTPVVTGYLIHTDGGAMSSGPVPLFVGDSDRRGQAHAAGLTTCRRLATQMVLGLAAERDDEFNSEADTQPRQAGRQAAAPRQAQAQQQAARTVTTPNRQQRAAGGPAAGAARTAPTRQGPPPGWLSKDDRAALEQELMDPNITPERFQEIEAKLLAANNLSQAAAAPAQGQQP